MSIEKLTPAVYQYTLFDADGRCEWVDCNYETYMMYKKRQNDPEWLAVYRYEVRRLYSEFDLKDNK